MTEFTGIEQLSDAQLHQLYRAALHRMIDKKSRCTMCMAMDGLCRQCPAWIVMSEDGYGKDCVCSTYQDPFDGRDTFLDDLADALKADATRRRGDFKWLGMNNSQGGVK